MISTPLLPVAVAFVVGTAAAGWPTLPAVLWVAGAVAALACAVAALLGWLRVATGAVLIAVACLGTLHATRAPLPPDHLAVLPGPSAAVLHGRVVTDPITRGGQFTRFVLDADTLVTHDVSRAVTGRVLLSLYGTPPPLGEGQRIAAEVRLRAPRSFRNPGGFDYVAHLARREIHLVGSGRADRITPLTAGTPPWRVVVKRRAVETIHAALPPASGALLAGLLLGERVELPPETHEAFRRAGVYHVLAVSGFNVALLAAAVFATLALAGIPRRVVAVVAIAIVVAFALVVGPEPSVLRATIMAVLLLLAVVLERDARVLNSVAAAAILILAMRPGDLADPGSQLSFGATLGIVLLGVPLSRALAGRRVPRWIADGIAVSLAAQLAVTPIMLAHFNQLSIIGVIANLVVVPLAAVATVAGLLAVVVALGTEVIGHALFDGVWLVLLALRACVHAAASVPGAMVHLPAPPWPAMVAFYGGLGMAVAVRGRARRAEGEPSQKTPEMTHPGKRNPVPDAGQPSQSNREQAPGRVEPGRLRAPDGADPYGRWPLAAAALLMLTGTAIALWPVLRPADGTLRATFLDVGQGDAIVIELPDGRTLLVDAGPGGPGRVDAGARIVAPFLWNRGVRRIAAMIPTHDDADHAGGAPSIAKLFFVDEIWSTGTLAMAEGPGLVRRWFGDVAVSVLSPPAEGLPRLSRRPAADRNNGSIVLRIDFGLASLLLTGDIEAEAEDYLRRSHAPIRALVLKVAHHGGARSTSPAFLEVVRPGFAVISAGAGNRFGHPAPETLARLRQSGARIYRTDEHGAVQIETDGAALTITTWADRRRERFDLAPPETP